MQTHKCNSFYYPIFAIHNITSCFENSVFDYLVIYFGNYLNEYSSLKFLYHIIIYFSNGLSIIQRLTMSLNTNGESMTLFEYPKRFKNSITSHVSLCDNGRNFTYSG